MSTKTKIVVLRMKELIYTGILVALGILLIILLVIGLRSNKEQPSSTPSPENATPTTEDGEETLSESIYIPGVYTTELVLGGQAVEVEVMVDSYTITSIQLVNLDESIATMYPLLQPTLDSLKEQIYTKQSLEDITYPSDSKYTSLVLLEAVSNSLEKAKIEQQSQEETAAYE